jgi:hypothetical protein
VVRFDFDNPALAWLRFEISPANRSIYRITSAVFLRIGGVMPSFSRQSANALSVLFDPLDLLGLEPFFIVDW